ncbi:MobA/MobL family protein [Salmonella enterica]|nr:MobA/MobL family protein [Salmonella enterica]HCM4478645.1 MobA/MobL family protein [Salmonella enterica subsp. enterica serovar Java]MDJ7790198.1 MobA/MobL family protein [Salmonella enterica]MDJ7812594.1 MobA/MobL family protein [Salmonella enterica]MDJ7942551.1 MobA/MobL family protein [Salmonella enterica]
MAIFHMSAQTITRSKGHSSVAASAYRHGEKLTDEHTGEIHDYSKKKGISDSVILIPESADLNFLKTGYLWNTIEKSEKRKDAQLAREFNIALPVEMTDEQKKALAIDFCQEHFVKNGMIADIAFHKLDSDNPHFHVMLTTRRLTPDGAGFGQKVREWNSKEQLQEWRKSWADTANEHMQKAGIDARIDHRSLKEQKAELDAILPPLRTVEQEAQAISLDRPPTIHRGHSRNPERQARFDVLQGVKVSQEAKALNHIEQKQPKPSPLAPASSPAASLQDATQGGNENNPQNKLGEVGEYLQSKLNKEDKADFNADNEIKVHTTKNNSKSSSAAAIGSTSNINLTDEKVDKNLHLTEAQKEELEDLENKEVAAKKKAYLMSGAAVPELSQDNKTQSKSEFRNKLHTAKQSISFTEQRFNEEREAYENRRNRPIPR